MNQAEWNTVAGMIEADGRRISDLAERLPRDGHIHAQERLRAILEKIEHVRVLVGELQEVVQGEPERKP